MKLTILVAMSDDRVIGREGGLPWRLSADLRRFKQITMGHCLLMGRKTYESIGRPLPGRTSVVITHKDHLDVPEGVYVARNFGEALRRVAGQDEVFVIGGGEIYEQALPLASRILMTRVHARVEGDTYFPTFDPDQWRVVEEQRFSADENNAYDYSFLTLDRVEAREFVVPPLGG